MTMLVEKLEYMVLCMVVNPDFPLENSGDTNIAIRLEIGEATYNALKNNSMSFRDMENGSLRLFKINTRNEKGNFLCYRTKNNKSDWQEAKDLDEFCKAVGGKPLFSRLVVSLKRYPNLVIQLVYALSSLSFATVASVTLSMVTRIENIARKLGFTPNWTNNTNIIPSCLQKTCNMIRVTSVMDNYWIELQRGDNHTSLFKKVAFSVLCGILSVALHYYPMALCFYVGQSLFLAGDMMFKGTLVYRMLVGCAQIGYALPKPLQGIVVVLAKDFYVEKVQDAVVDVKTRLGIHEGSVANHIVNLFGNASGK